MSNERRRQIWKLRRGGELLSVAWSPDGTQLVVGSSVDNKVEAFTAEGRVLWTGKGHSGTVLGVSWSPDGRNVASGSRDRSVRVWDAVTGIEQLRFDDHEGDVFSVAWAKDGGRLASGSLDNKIRIWDPRRARPIGQLVGHRGAIKSISWAPEGRRLASASWDHFAGVWDVESSQRLKKYEQSQGSLASVAWSPNSERIASGSSRGGIHIWNAQSGEILQKCEGHRSQIESLAWSPDGRRLASGSADNTVRLWEPESGREVVQVGEHKQVVWAVAFSPDGNRLASSSGDYELALWDISEFVPAVQQRRKWETTEWLRRQAATVGRALPGPSAGEAPSELLLPMSLAPWPGALAACHRLKQFPPLSLLRDLCEHLGGASVDSLVALASDPNIDRLVQLQWPRAARIGLATLLLRRLVEDGKKEWHPPAEVSPSELRRRLAQALSGDEIRPEAPSPPVALLIKAAEVVDDGLLTLLLALGPDAVSADPGLPLRLLRRAPQVSGISHSLRRLLGLRLRPSESGPAQGTGAGFDRSGLASAGTVLSMVPSQFAYPESLLAWRHRNGGLLFRARTGREPPHFRPAVVVLDVSPSCFGPIEGVIRVAAVALVSTLRSLNLPVVVVLATGVERIRFMDEPGDVLEVLTHRTLEAADPEAALATAERLRLRLASDGAEPVIVLLTHAWWGAGVDGGRSLGSLRGLFVQYPGQNVDPPWAERCERRLSLSCNDHDKLAESLGILIG